LCVLTAGRQCREYSSARLLCTLLRAVGCCCQGVRCGSGCQNSYTTTACALFPPNRSHHQALKQDEAWSEFKERCTAEGCSVTHLDISACPGVSDKAFGPLAGFAYLKVRRSLWPSVVDGHSIVRFSQLLSYYHSVCGMLSFRVQNDK
jgi:hypothetical protein